MKQKCLQERFRKLDHRLKAHDIIYRRRGPAEGGEDAFCFYKGFNVGNMINK